MKLLAIDLVRHALLSSRGCSSRLGYVPIRRVGSPQRPRGHETHARASLRLWPGQILARLVLSTLLPIFLLGGLLGLELGVEHGEYDPYETHQPHPARQADPQHTIEGVPVGLADHKRSRDGDVEDGKLCAALGHPDGFTPVSLPRCHRHGPYDTERTQGIEQPQRREHAARELRESSHVGPGTSRAHTEHLHEAAGTLQSGPSERPEELLGPMTHHKRALHHTHDHWRHFVDLRGVHPHSFRGQPGPCYPRPPETRGPLLCSIPETIPFTLLPFCARLRGRCRPVIKSALNCSFTPMDYPACA